MSVSQSDKANRLTKGVGAALLRRQSPLLQPVVKKRRRRRRKKEETPVTEENRPHLYPSELKAFFKNIQPNSYWYSYFFIQYHFGCKLSEPALLLEEDLDFAGNKLVIRRLRKDEDGRGFRQCVYPMDPRIVRCLKVALSNKESRELTDNPFVFPSNRHRREDQIGSERLSQLRNLEGWQAISRFTAHRTFRKVAMGSRLPDRLRQSQHVLRHTRAVVMLSLGAPSDWVQRFLGHSSRRMTEKYRRAAMDLRGKFDAEFLSMGLGL